jgi:hypothetical protein
MNETGPPAGGPLFLFDAAMPLAYHLSCRSHANDARNATDRRRAHRARSAALLHLQVFRQ